MSPRRVVDHRAVGLEAGPHPLGELLERAVFDVQVKVLRNALADVDLSARAHLVVKVCLQVDGGVGAIAGAGGDVDRLERLRLDCQDTPPAICARPRELPPHLAGHARPAARRVETREGRRRTEPAQLRPAKALGELCALVGACLHLRAVRVRAASRTASLLGRGDALTDKRECARARERQQCSVTSSDERLSERTTSLESSGPLLAARTGADLEALGYRSGPRSVGQASEYEAAAKQNIYTQVCVYERRVSFVLGFR